MQIKILAIRDSRHKKTFKKLCTGDGAGAVIPAGSKLGSGAGAEKAQNSWARLFASSQSCRAKFTFKCSLGVSSTTPRPLDSGVVQDLWRHQTMLNCLVVGREDQAGCPFQKVFQKILYNESSSAQQQQQCQ